MPEEVLEGQQQHRRRGNTIIFFNKYVSICSPTHAFFDSLRVALDEGKVGSTQMLYKTLLLDSFLFVVGEMMNVIIIGERHSSPSRIYLIENRFTHPTP